MCIPGYVIFLSFLQVSNMVPNSTLKTAFLFLHFTIFITSSPYFFSYFLFLILKILINFCAMGSIIHYWLLSSAVLDVNFPYCIFFFLLSFFFFWQGGGCVSQRNSRYMFFLRTSFSFICMTISSARIRFTLRGYRFLC